jgi:putative ABC transport system substrate-binding protein
MQRREFITLIGGAAAAWPLAVGAQQQARRTARIGFLGAATAAGFASRVEAFRSGLRELGYVEGTNIAIDFRWAEDKYERLPALAGQLVHANVDVIVTHGTPGTLAAKQATASIPIVFATIGDPVALGVVASFARPGGNITGQSFFNPELSAKRIELLKELVPAISRVAYILNPDNPASSGAVIEAVQTAAQSLKVELQQFQTRGPSEFEHTFERMVQASMAAIVIDDDAMLNAHIGMIATLAIRRRLISVGNKDFAQAGGLIGYGVEFHAMFRRAAVFVDKILKGTMPADLPVEQATKFDFLINPQNRQGARS